MMTMTGVLIVLLIEAALMGLAVVHARTGKFPRITRWATLVIVAGTLPVSLMAIAEAVWEISTLPWTRPGNAFGTYYEPTGLMVLGVAIDAVLWIVAAVLAFLRPRAATLLYTLMGLWWIAEAARVRLFDPSTAPPESTATGAVSAAIPALVVAALLFSVREPLLRRRARAGAGPSS